MQVQVQTLQQCDDTAGVMEQAQQPKYLSTQTNVHESRTLLSTKCQADQHELFTFLQSATKDISSFLRLTNGRGLESTAGETYR
eukprot:m.250295 g.250295  ORF g.250295 m.250295 type:complete len:84 (+) comp40316_c0_seq4:1954-2205(+)